MAIKRSRNDDRPSNFDPAYMTPRKKGDLPTWAEAAPPAKKLPPGTKVHVSPSGKVTTSTSSPRIRVTGVRDLTTGQAVPRKRS